MKQQAQLFSNCLHQNFNNGQQLQPVSSLIGNGIDNLILKIISPSTGTATIIKYFSEPMVISPYYVIGIGCTATHHFAKNKYLRLRKSHQLFLGIKLQGKQWQKRKQQINCPVNGWSCHAQYGISYFTLISQRFYKHRQYTIYNSPSSYKQTLILGYPFDKNEPYYSQGQVKQHVSFTFAISNDCYRGMSGGPVYLFNKDGQPQLLGIVIQGCWVPSKIVVSIIQNKIQLQRMITKQDLCYYIDQAYVKVLNDCKFDAERQIILNTWRSIIKQIIKLHKQQYKHALMITLEAELYKQWKILLQESPARYDYLMCNRIKQDIQTLIQSIRLEDIDQSKLILGFQLNKLEVQSLMLIRANKDKNKDYFYYLIQENAKEVRRKYQIKLQLIKVQQKFRLIFQKQIKQDIKLLKCFQLIWTPVLLKIPTLITQVIVFISDPNNYLRATKSGVQAIDWFYHQIDKYTGIDPQLIYL